MATAWTTTEKQVTGEVQYVIATGDDLGAATSVAFDVSGYTQGSIAATNADGGTITINGSNDANTAVTPPSGGNYFILTPAVTFAAGTPNVITWTTPVKTITITATLVGGGLFTAITVMATAGGSGSGAGGGGGGSGTVAAGTPQQMAYYTGGTTIASTADAIANTGTTAQILFTAGTNALPVVAFQGDPDTGMYSAGANIIGFATAGAAKVGIFAADGGDFIEGLNVGLTTNIAGIRRLSATAANSWEDGNCGNSEFIVFTAADFMSFSSRNPTFVTYSTAATIRSPVVYNNALAGPALACKLIPKGFIIDNGDGVNCFIYSDIATALGVPQQMDIDVRVQIAAGPTIDAALPIAAVTIPAAVVGWQTAGTGSVNRTVINIPAVPPAATGTGFNTINVLVTPTAAMSATTGGIVAFKVPIKRI